MASRWITVLFGGAALVLVPWVVLLVYELPSMHRSSHWDVAWAGFDVGLGAALVAVAVAAWRRSAWLEGAASAAAALLAADAWFDVATASGRMELGVALAEALLVELPMAVLCLLVARAAKRRLVAAAPTADTMSPARRLGRVVRHRSAKPGTPVRLR